MALQAGLKGRGVEKHGSSSLDGVGDSSGFFSFYAVPRQSPRCEDTLDNVCLQLSVFYQRLIFDLKIPGFLV